MATLTNAKVRSLSEPGLYGDGGTLFLRIAPGGSKSWVQRVTIEGKRRDMGLGGYPLTTLAEARDKAYRNRKLARDGGDPVAERRKARTPTFLEAFEGTYEATRHRWRSEKVARNWRQQMERHALPILGGLRVNQIGRDDVLRILTPIWTSSPETARRVRRHVKSILQWAIAHGHIENNMAGAAIDGALPRMPAVKAHHRAMPYHMVGAALETVAEGGRATTSKLAFRFLVLTAARSGEVRGATWGEIDLEARTWKIPAERMKAGAEHRVPLTDEAIEVLELARAFGDGSGLVFPSALRAGREMSDMTLTKLLRDRDLADKTTIHGFRSSFRDWCAETGKPREVAEAALAHAVGGVEGAYFRSDLFDRRRRLMAAWARHLVGGGGCESRAPAWLDSRGTSDTGATSARRSITPRRSFAPRLRLGGILAFQCW